MEYNLRIIEKCHWYFTNMRNVGAIVKNILNVVKVKVKCTLVQALSLCTGRTTHRGSKGIALLFLDHSARRV